MLFRFSATLMGAAVAACTCSTVNSGLISVIRRPLSVTSRTHISVMILLTQWEAVSGRRHFSKILGLPLDPDGGRRGRRAGDFAQRTGEMRMKHLLKLGGMTPEEILHILDVADEYKRLHKDGVDPKDLQGKAVALVFAKNSTRCPPTAARRSPPMCWKPTPTKFSTRRRTASTWKRPCWRCCWRGNKSMAVSSKTNGRGARAREPLLFCAE